VARKYKETEQVFSVLARSRIFVERYKEAIKHCEEGLLRFPDSKNLKGILDRARDEDKKELKRIDDVSTMQVLEKD